MSFNQVMSQMRPPAPVFTEKDCPDQTGKVFLITGGYSGVGYELAKILYQKNATVYIAGRSKSKADDAVKYIQESCPSSNGKLEFLFLDLNDLTTIKPAAEKFKAESDRLDVLWNNAGVMVPPKGSKTIQGYEMQLGCNCVAHFLLTKLLYPVLLQTVDLAAPNSVRVCWTGSLTAELHAPKGVINFNDINHEKGGSQNVKYGQSKAANILLGSEFAKRDSESGVLNLSLNPGNLKSGLQRHVGRIGDVMNNLLLYDPVYGAYTEMFAGLSPDITADVNGCYVIPWGRIAKLKANLEEATRSKEEGGTGAASRFYYWCEAEVARYM
ncbi:short-chain dehydrogenase [Xylogone sp. PMI_703]|nr:short-chain dehydrogenase [Xylogone sp. PMI_703]